MSKEIKRQIDELNLEMEQMIEPSTFVLNPKIIVLMNKINELQRQCKHNFNNGICEFCYMEEK